MSKTVEEIGLIIGGLALALVAGPVGLIALQGNIAVMNAMIGIGLSTALSGVGLALRPSAARTVGTANTLNVAQGPQPRRVIYGKFQTAGVLTFASFPSSQNLDTKNQYLQLVYTLAGHEISSFDGIVVNGTVRNFGTDLIYAAGGSGDLVWHLKPGNAPIADDMYWDHMFFEFDFGRNGSAPPFPALTVADPAWTNACVQQNCAKVHVVLRYDSNWTGIFPGGQIPNIQFLVTGKKIIDPRIITAWQASTAYVKYNYIVDNNGIVWRQQNTSGTSGAVRPNFEANEISGTFLADGSLSWRSSGESAIAVSFGIDTTPQGHVVNNRLVNNGWGPNVGFGQFKIIEAPLGYLQEQQLPVTGTTGATEPAFSTTLGGLTIDGGQQWRCLGRSWNAINPSNPALIVSDYLQDTEYGMGADPTTIDMSSVMAAANVCEEQVLIIWTADNHQLYENLYSCNGMFDHSSLRGDVLTRLCESMAGWVIPPGDLWHVFAGSFLAPLITIGDTDLRGPIKGDFRLSKREMANSAKGKFTPAYLPTNPAAGNSLTQIPAAWQSQSFPPYQANGSVAGKPNYLNTEDGGQIIWIDLQLDFVTSLWQAQRLAKIAVMKTRFPQTLTLPCKTIALQLEAGDNFEVFHNRWGINGQIYQAHQLGVTFDSQGAGGPDDVPVIGVDIVARQVDGNIYAFTGPLSPGDTGEYSPYGITGVMTGVE